MLIAIATTFIPLLLQDGYSQKNDTQQQNTTVGAAEPNSTSSIACKSIASQIGSNAFPIQNPNPEICDISIIRNSPQIVDQDGTILNKFLVANTLVEIMGHSNVATSSGNSSNGNNNGTGSILNASSSQSNRQNVVAMIELALLQTELKPVLNLISKTNWTIVAIHNHALLENPDTIFVHANAKGTLANIIFPIKEVLAFQQQQQQEQQQSAKQTDNATKQGQQQQLQGNQNPGITLDLTTPTAGNLSGGDKKGSLDLDFNKSTISGIAKVNEPPAKDKVYEGWFEDKGDASGYSLSVGKFDGNGTLVINQTMVNPYTYTVFYVTAEPVKDLDPRPSDIVVGTQLPEPFGQ
jgi:Domain of Unknown Function (DUF1259)